MTRPPEDEITRQTRLVDQLTTMHSALRDRASSSTTTITVVLLSASVFSIGFAFAGDLAHVTLLGMTAARSTWLGILAVFTFCGTVADLVTDRRGIARKHDRAVRLLADLKSEYRLVDPGEPPTDRQARLGARYQAVMAELPPIPERRFNKLKSEHLRKVEISKILSANPGVSQRQARAKLRQRFR